MKNNQLNFGQFVKRELSNRDSELSKRVRFYKNFCNFVKNHPKIYNFRWFAGYPIYEFKSVITNNWEKVDYPSYDKDEIRFFRQ